MTISNKLVSNAGANLTIRSTTLQPDGKLLVYGSFTQWDGVTANNLVRLNAKNYAVDTAFNANLGTGGNGAVRSAVVQPDGKIIIAGAFTTWNGASAPYIARLNPNGTIDTAFQTNIGTGPNPDIFIVKLQSDGKIIVGGGFNTWNGASGINRIVRLNSDGTRDTAFTTNVGTAANTATVRAIALQDNQQIVIGGGFTSWNGVNVNRILRLNSDGTRDTTFTTNTGTAANTGAVLSVSVQADGKLVLSGSFTSWNGLNTNYIIRLNSNGTTDTLFNSNNNTIGDGSISVSVVLPGQKILVGGVFTTWNGVTVNRIVVLNTDGIRDTNFTTNAGTAADADINSGIVDGYGQIIISGDFNTWNGATVNKITRVSQSGIISPLTGSRFFDVATPYTKVAGVWKPAKAVYNKHDGVWSSSFLQGGVNDIGFATNTGTAGNFTISAIAIQSDGKIVLGGAFTTWNGATVNYIVRLNSDGTRDTAFTTNTGTAASGGINAIAIQSDGKILVGGQFTTWNGVTVNRIVRLNSDGTRDTAFTTNTGTAANTTVNAIAIQSDGKIVLGGAFTTWNGATVNYIVRLNSDGTRDTAFTTNTGTAASGGIVTAIAIQSDGKILVGGNFDKWNGVTVNRIVRLNSDGTRDTAFTTNVGTAANLVIYAIAIQSDGKIILGGNFTTWNGATVNYIVRLNSDGTRDTAFTTNVGTAADSRNNAIAIQSDGKILVGGQFTTWNGVTVNRIVRLNSDGTRDTAFTTNTGTAADGGISAIAIQSDGKILVGGSFPTWNGVTLNRIVRIGGELAI